MAKILGLTFVFPPGDSVANRRFINYINVLNKLSHNINVITCDEQTYYKKNIPVNTKTLQKINSVNIYRIKYLKAPNIIQKILWIISAIIIGIKLNKNNKFDYILATGDPWFVLIAGVILNFLIKSYFIADYRDPWSLNINIKRGKFSKIMDGLVLNKCKYAFFTTNAIKQTYSKHFQKYSDKFIVIENGININDVQINNNYFFKWNEEHKIKFIFSGNIISPRLSGLKWFCNIINQLPEYEQKLLNIIFYTNTPDIIKNICNIKSVNKIIINPYVPVTVLYNAIHKSDVALMIDNSLLEIATKLLEYLYLQKPILAIVPDNSSNAQLVKKYNAGWIINKKIHKKESLNTIRKIITLWKNKKLQYYCNIPAKELIFDKNFNIIKEIFK